jgi:hypothetical protein
MNFDPCRLIVVDDGYWMHIRHTRIYHRHYPEARGEGRTLAEAARGLASELTRGLDFVHGPDRESVERAVADIRRCARRAPGCGRARVRSSPHTLQTSPQRSG